MRYLEKLQRCRDPQKVALYIRALGTQFAATTGVSDSDRMALVVLANNRADLCENASNMKEVKRMLQEWGYLPDKKKRGKCDPVG